MQDTYIKKNARHWWTHIEYRTHLVNRTQDTYIAEFCSAGLEHARRESHTVTARDRDRDRDGGAKKKKSAHNGCFAT
jgi:hypothetical protein